MTRDPEKDEEAKELLARWAVWPLRAWLVMLALGGLHSETGWPVNVSFWAALLGVLIVRLTIGNISVRSR